MMFTFNQFWLAESIRLKEDLQGPLDDAVLRLGLQKQNALVEEKILSRALALAKRLGLDTQQKQALSVGYLCFWGFIAVMFCVGVGTAYGVLGTQGGKVNLLSSWVVILGLNSLVFLAWCLLMLLSWHRKPNPFLGRLWLKLVKKLTHHKDGRLLLNGYLSAMQKALSWRLSCFSHAFWLTYLLGVAVGLIFLLATRRYFFEWETTILSREQLTWVSHAISFIPSLLGFPNPDVQALMQEKASMDRTLQSLWSWWLLGQVCTWGLIPRALAWLLCALRCAYVRKKQSINLSDPYYATLAQSLSPNVQAMGTDAPEQPMPAQGLSLNPLTDGQGSLLLGVELNPQQTWPPFDVPASLQVGINIDDREQRHAVFAQLTASQRLKQLVLVCDAQQVPDRSQLQLIRALAPFAQQAALYLLDGPYRTQWLEKTTELGIKPQFSTPDSLAQWVTQ